LYKHILLPGKYENTTDETLEITYPVVNYPGSDLLGLTLISICNKTRIKRSKCLSRIYQLILSQQMLQGSYRIAEILSFQSY